MSQYRVRFLVCDKPLCKAQFVHAEWATRQLIPLSTLRQAARRDGWKRTVGNRDYCPQHNPWPGFTAWALAKQSEGSTP